MPSSSRKAFHMRMSLDRYVTSGEGDLRDLMNGLAGWYLWDTEEMLELVQWVRRNQQGPTSLPRRIRIFGMDITSTRLGGSTSHWTFLKDAGDGPPVGGSRAFGLDLQQGDFWPKYLGKICGTVR